MKLAVFILLMAPGVISAQPFAGSGSQARICKARQDLENQTWSANINRSADDVRQLRASVAAAAESRTPVDLSHSWRCSHIVTLDTKSLADRQQILFVEGDGGPCIKINVIQSRSPFAPVWSLRADALKTVMSNLPVPDGDMICSRSAPKPPRAYATAEGKIFLEIPSPRRYLDQRAFPPYVVSFLWNGANYVTDQP